MKVARYLSLGILLSSLALAQQPPAGFATKDMNELTVEQLSQLLAGPGITIANMTLIGAKQAAGTFTGGLTTGIGIDSGVIMSTGDIKDAAGPNNTQGKSGNLNVPGDASLDAIVAPNKTNDATILEFDFVTASPNFNIKYVFASEEYKEFVGSQFNDVFAFFLNNQNIALIPGTNAPVAINSVNHLQNTAESRTANLTAFQVPLFGDPLVLSASGLPSDSSVTFSPAAIDRDRPRSTITVNIGPTTLPNSHLVIIRAANNQGGEFFTTMMVHVDCSPPFIFDLDEFQPTSQSVTSGSTATLRVVPSGSGPLSYQWYFGPRGSTFFPIQGATSAQFTTAPIFGPTSFWVRVSNPCGNVDSESALVTPR